MGTSAQQARDSSTTLLFLVTVLGNRSNGRETKRKIDYMSLTIRHGAHMRLNDDQSSVLCNPANVCNHKEHELKDSLDMIDDEI